MSLQQISLKDFVIVRSLELELASGFTVLTGETGAGKSILIDALQLVLGGRADSTLVRQGQRRAEVSAVFSATESVQNWLEVQEMDTADECVLLRRTVDEQGRSRGWINGTSATASQLKELGERLVDIHGQHAWQGLTRPDSCKHLLDAYGKVESQRLAAPWLAWRAAHDAFLEASAHQEQMAEERERLAWQVADVEKIAPKADQWAELQSEHTKLSHVNELIECAQQAAALLSDGDDGATRQISRAQQLLKQQQGLEPFFSTAVGVMEQVLMLSHDMSRDLQAYSRRTEANPDRLAELEAQLGAWLSAARRHRCRPEELPERLQTWQARLLELENAADLAVLAKKEAIAKAAYETVATDITRQREKAANSLGRDISAVMQVLGMEGGVFEVGLLPLAQPSSGGMESVEFRVAGHGGSVPRPVAKVASGGELSRIALAIAVTTSKLGESPTLIFDEVDSGIGGTVAHTVGHLMRDLGADRQVLAVTHLPQVAACADHHVQVAKVRTTEGVESVVTALTSEARVHEVARMLGGEGATDASTAHAREMLSS
jgi:DNA repair protein RecN (Recombination protein N)